jgi:hypothetical protein
MLSSLHVPAASTTALRCAAVTAARCCEIDGEHMARYAHCERCRSCGAAEAAATIVMNGFATVEDGPRLTVRSAHIAGRRYRSIRGRLSPSAPGAKRKGNSDSRAPLLASTICWRGAVRNGGATALLPMALGHGLDRMAQYAAPDSTAAAPA